MARIMTPVWMVVAVGLSCSIVLGQAQDAKAPDPKPSPKQPPKPPQKEEFLPVDKILTQAVKNIAVRYNLNAEQHEFTDQLMTREVHKFLREHRQEVWPVLRDLMRWQMEGKAPPVDAAKRLSQAIEPLLQRAIDAILEGNQEWRDCLTPTQKRLHDWDVNEMHRTFGRITDNLNDWKTGKPKAGGLFPPPPDMSKQPPRPTKPPPGLPTPHIATIHSGLFEGLVKRFVEANGLDAAQVQAARSILDEFKEKADLYYKSKRKEFAAVWADKSADADVRRTAYLAQKELLKPINGMVNEMERRLVKLLASEQLERYRERHGEKKVEADPQSDSPKTATSPKRGRSKKQKTDKSKPPAEGDASNNKSDSDARG